MKEIFKRVLRYDKTQRLQRIIEIAVKGENASGLEQIELAAIQSIRYANGEIEEVVKNQQV